MKIILKTKLYKLIRLINEKTTENNYKKLNINDRLFIKHKFADIKRYAALTNDINTNKRKAANKEALDYILKNYICDEVINARRTLLFIGDAAIYLNKQMLNIIEVLINKSIYNSQKQGEKAIKLINDYYNSIRLTTYTIGTQDYDGCWYETTAYRKDGVKQRRHDYHAHPETYDKKTSQEGLKKGESLKGIEGEGAFRSEADFQAFIREARETDFKGGKLYDKRNFFMPTDDGSLSGGFCVEWGTCPMSSAFANEFGQVFNTLLKKHHGESSTEKNGSSIHCHIDAHLFNQETLRDLINHIYDMPAEAKERMYMRVNNEYAKGDKDNCYNENGYFKETKYLDAQGKALYEKAIYLRQGNRYSLINLEHIGYGYKGNNEGYDYDKLHGTIELRGGNGSQNPLNVIKQVDAIITATTTRGLICAA